MKVRVYVGTTEGPVQIERITREPAPQSAICVQRTTREASVSASYDAFVRQPSGVIEREFGSLTPGAFRLDVSADIAEGSSWQLGVFAAHALLAVDRLATIGTQPDAAIWLTGEVANDLEVQPVGHLADKLRATRAAFDEIARQNIPITLFVPEGNRAELSSEALPEAIECIAVRAIPEVLNALSIDYSHRATILPAVTDPPHRAVAASGGRRRWGRRVTLAGGILAVGASAAFVTDRDVREWARDMPWSAPEPPPTVVLNLGMILYAINLFVVATIMPTVVADLGGVDYYTWTFSLFALGTIIGSASIGPLSDALGTRRAYAGCGLILGIGLAGAALAPDMPTLVAFRLIQGIGGGAVASQAYGLVAVVYPRRLRSRVLGVVSTVWGVATLTGPGFGGVFAAYGIWRGTFWSLVPLTVLFSLLVWRYIDDTPGHGRFSEIPYQRLALFGLAIVVLSTTSLADATWLRVLLIAVSIAITAVALARDARAKRNMIPRQATTIGTQLGAAYWILFLMSIVMTFVSTYTTYFLQVLHDVAPLNAGYLFSIQSIMWTTSALIIATLRSQWETACIVTGLGLVLLASIGLALTVTTGPIMAIAIAIGINGLGIGLINNPVIQRVIALAPEAEKHVAGTSIQTVRNIAIAFGAAASGMVAAAAGLSDAAGRADIAVAMENVFAVNVVFALLAFAMVVPLLAGRRKAHGQSTD